MRESSTSRVSFDFAGSGAAAALCLSSAALTAALMLGQPGLNTPGELGIILFWTTPLAIASGLAVGLAAPLISRIGGCLRYTLAPVIGATAGFIWGAVVLTAFLSPFFGTFSIPVGLVWVVAGITGFLPIAAGGSRRAAGGWLMLAGTAGVISLIVGLTGDRLLASLYQERTVDTVWIRWFPGSQPLDFDPRLQEELTQQERNRLLEIGVTGRLDWQGSDRLERGPESRLVILMQLPVAEPIDLALPAGEPVIYIQRADGSWLIDPPDAPLMDRSIRLAPDPDKLQDTGAFLKVPGGTVMFGGINWTVEQLP